MNLFLNIYTDESLTEVERVAEADRLKIPYRVATYIGQSLDKLDVKNDSDLLNFVGGNVENLDKIIKATFGITDTDLERVDAAELGAVAMEIYKWGMDKLNSLKGKNSKNVTTTA